MPLGPYDYPGEYAFRFDGIDKGEWCGYFTSWNRTEGRQPLRIENLRVSGLRGVTVMTSWQRSVSLTGGSPKTLLIEQLSSAKVAVARWKVRNAKPIKWTAAPSASNNDIHIEKIELVHEGISRV